MQIRQKKKKDKEDDDRKFEEYEEREKKKFNHHKPIFNKLWDDWFNKDESVGDKLKDTEEDTVDSLGYDFETTVDIV